MKNKIELAVVEYFGYRRNIIVPNVSWGIGIHECDILIVTKAKYAIEVEIKTSRADLIADKKKKHGHYSDKVRVLYFAIPESLLDLDIIQYVPERAGIFVVNGGIISLLRKPAINKTARKLTETECLKVAHLGTMRIWNLKKKVYEKENNP